MTNKTTGAVPPASAAVAGRLGMSLYRCQKLAYHLGAVAAGLARGEPHDVPDEHLDDYLRLGWLRWEAEGGRLRLTPDGAEVCSTQA